MIRDDGNDQGLVSEHSISKSSAQPTSTNTQVTSTLERGLPMAGCSYGTGGESHCLSSFAPQSNIRNDGDIGVVGQRSFPASHLLGGSIDQGVIQYDVISNPVTAGVSLARSVAPELKAKIMSDKFVELSTLIDPKHGETFFALKGQDTDEGFLPVWSALQPKEKPLSVEMVSGFPKIWFCFRRG